MRTFAALAFTLILCTILQLSCMAVGTVKAGDMDGDGGVTANDLRLLLERLSGQDVTLNAPGDVNGDGKNDIGDAIRLLKYLIGQDVALYPDDSTVSEEERPMLQLTIGSTPVPVTWEDNESVQALQELARGDGMSVQMSMYGGFEQVGPLGQSLPRNDVHTTTDYGDIVLYSGDQIVIFYGSNSWSYTRLGHADLSRAEMTELLGGAMLLSRFAPPHKGGFASIIAGYHFRQTRFPELIRVSGKRCLPYSMASSMAPAA